VREDGATLDQGSGAVVRTVHQARRLARRAGGGKRAGARRRLAKVWRDWGNMDKLDT